ncbi:MAG: hypothetical protein HW421_975 [Ignavibacteria bacterium]|nr:hypothetical protein [Ignavibacteria bacterium]
MPHLTPVSRKDLIKKLISIGFTGPFSGGKHSYLLKDDIRLTLPNPHKNEIGIDLLQRILKQVDISKEDWMNV